LNSFCKDCRHKDVPKFLKIHYNKLVKKTFIECPTNDKKILGCTIKYKKIRWEEVSKYLLKRETLSKKEYNRLKAFLLKEKVKEHEKRKDI